MTSAPARPGRLRCCALALLAAASLGTARAQPFASQAAGVPGPGGKSSSQPDEDGAPSIGQGSGRGDGTPDGLAWSKDRLLLTAANGNFTASPVIRLDGDSASFFDQNRRGFENGLALRRGYVGIRGTFLRDFEYNYTWNFGSRPGPYNVLFQAQIAWTGLGWGTLRAGAFTLQHMPEFASNSFDLLFMERSAINTIAASLASGISRFATGLEARGQRWNASIYASTGLASTLHDEKQRGLVGRAVYVALDQPWAQLQAGFDGAAQFRAGTSAGPDSINLRDFLELRGGSSTRVLSTGGIRSDDSYAVGPELAGRIGPAYVEAVYQRINVDLTGGGSRSFSGWYAAAALPVLGSPRERDFLSGTWVRPKTKGFVNPRNGNWGAVELMARYSVADLRDGTVQGGRQRIWTAGAQWYLSPNLKLHLQYENGRVDLSGSSRDFQAVGARVSLSL